MPYLLRDRRAVSSEELYWFVEMGAVVGEDVIPSKLSIPEPIQKKMEDNLLGPSIDGEVHWEQIGDVVEGVALHPSQPPSPPESRPETPRITIAPCPIRLTSFTPPKNYGAVERNIIFRSGFPFWNNVDFLESLRIKSLLTLVDESLSSEVELFLNVYDVKHACVSVLPNKDGRHTTLDSLCQAILFILNPTHHPVYIHCNQGKHRTGCVVACLRKVQQWPLDEILAEYDTYSSPKARAGDIELIKAFDPSIVYEYAQGHDLLDSWPRQRRQSSAADIWELAAALPAHELTMMPKDDGGEDFDNGLLMTPSPGHVSCPVRENRVSVSGHDQRNHINSSHSTTDVIVTEVVDEDNENVLMSDRHFSVIDEGDIDAGPAEEPVVFATASAQLVATPAVRPIPR